VLVVRLIPQDSRALHLIVFHQPARNAVCQRAVPPKNLIHGIHVKVGRGECFSERTAFLRNSIKGNNPFPVFRHVQQMDPQRQDRNADMRRPRRPVEFEPCSKSIIDVVGRRFRTRPSARLQREMEKFVSIAITGGFSEASEPISLAVWVKERENEDPPAASGCPTA